MNETEIKSLLENLGLTEYEAKTLTSLFKLKESEAPQISRAAQVPKTRVYDVLDRLTKRGLIIEIYGRPKKYRVIEPNSVFSQLIENRKEEIKILEQKSENISKTLEQKTGATETSEKVMKVKDKLDYMRILSQEIDSAKTEIVGFTGMEKKHNLVKESLKNATHKKVNIKLISHTPKEINTLIKEYQAMGIDIKKLEHGMNAYIIDNKKVVLGLSDFNREKPEYHFTIWNNNKSFANALTHYFDACWKNSTII